MSSLELAASAPAYRRHRPGQKVLYAVIAEHYQRLLKQHGIERSVSRRGEYHDNAVMESFFSRLRTNVRAGRSNAVAM